MRTKVKHNKMIEWPLHKLAEYAGYLAKEAQEGDFSDFNALVTADTIPLDHARELVWKDKFLSGQQKAQVETVFNHTGVDTATGKTSMSGLTAGAMRAGFGLAGGIVAGSVMGKLFALPKPVTRAMSAAGGIAGALINSGVVK